MAKNPEQEKLEATYKKDEKLAASSLKAEKIPK
jgi:hypothetical protein